MVSRNGLRNPWATIRRVFRSELETSGLPAAASPVSGSIRMMEPARPVGSPVVRTSCERRAPASLDATSTVGVVPGAEVTVSGSLHGLMGVYGLVGLGTVPP